VPIINSLDLLPFMTPPHWSKTLTYDPKFVCQVRTLDPLPLWKIKKNKNLRPYINVNMVDWCTKPTELGTKIKHQSHFEIDGNPTLFLPKFIFCFSLMWCKCWVWHPWLLGMQYNPQKLKWPYLTNRGFEILDILNLHQLL